MLAPTGWEAWVKDHPQLPGLLFAVACLVLLVLVALPRLGSWRRGRNRPVLDPVQASELLSGSGVLVVDLRRAESFRSGHIRGSLNLPYKDLAKRFAAPDPHARRDMLLVDETDELSHKAFDLLANRGFSGVYVLKGGLRAWRKASRPIAR